MIFRTPRLSSVLLVLCSALALCWVAFYNGFPLLYSDTGTYIRTGFVDYVPADRTVFYGIFIRHISLATYLFLVVFVQGILVAYLLFKLFDLFFTSRRNQYFVISVVILACTTGLSHNVSILIPDIFCAIPLLAIAVLLLDKELPKLEMGIISIILLFSICAHLSNLVIFSFVLAAAFIATFVRRRKTAHGKDELKRLVSIAGVVLSAALVIPIVNYATEGRWELSGGSHVFMVGHLNETGLLSEFLNENCDTKPYTLCYLKDGPVPVFVWNPSSPHLGPEGWRGTKDEYNDVIWDMLSSPKYLCGVLKQGLVFSARQFITFELEPRGKQEEGSPPHQQVSSKFKASMPYYNGAKQNNQGLTFDLSNTLQYLVVIPGMVLLILVLITPKLRSKVSSRILMFNWLVLYLILISPVVCSNLSTVSPRFQNRIIWLVPLGALIILFHWIENRRLPKEKAS